MRSTPDRHQSRRAPALLLGLLPTLGAAQDPKPVEPPAEAARPVPAPAPEPPAPAADPAADALRAFLGAMVTQDEPKLRSLMLSTDGIEWLLKGDKVTGFQGVAARTLVARQKYRHLQPGDEVSLPGGRKLVVQPSEVSATRAVLTVEGGPIPWRLEQVEGTWKVDARPVIAGRRVAAARAQAKEQAKPGPSGEAAPKPEPKP